MRNEFNPGRALNIKIMRAVDAAGGKDAICRPILDAAFEIVKDADVPAMRELGGFSKVIEGLLPTEGLIHDYLYQNLGNLREALQVRVAEYPRTM